MVMDLRESGVASLRIENEDVKLTLNGGFKVNGRRLIADFPLTEDDREDLRRPDVAGINFTGDAQDDGSIVLDDGKRIVRI